MESIPIDTLGRQCSARRRYGQAERAEESIHTFVDGVFGLRSSCVDTSMAMGRVVRMADFLTVLSVIAFIAMFSGLIWALDRV